jgi:hypothetical protein
MGFSDTHVIFVVCHSCGGRRQEGVRLAVRRVSGSRRVELDEGRYAFSSSDDSWGFV